MSSKCISAALAMAAMCLGQTQVDLKTQSKNVDFSQASSVRPFPTGTSLPATCTVGSIFFKTDAAPGANLFGCVAANTWAEEAGGGGGGGTGGGSPVGIPLEITRTSTVLTVGAGCSISSPCRVRVGSVVYSYVSPATATITGGTGTVYFYVDANGLITAGRSSDSTPGFTCSGCSAVNGVTQFPEDSLPLGSWNATAGVWDTTGTDSRAILSRGPALIAGTNVALMSAGNTVTISATGGGFSLQNPTAGNPAGLRPSPGSSPDAGSTISQSEGNFSAAEAVCGESTRGTFRHLAGARKEKDRVQVCAKDAADRYAWRTIY